MKTLILLFSCLFILQNTIAENPAYNQEFRINSESGGFQWKPEIVALNNGNVVICWVTYIYQKYTAYGQLFNKDLQKIGTEFKINSSHYLNDAEMAVTALTDGGFVVLWRVDSVMAQIFNSDGTKRGAEFGVLGSYYGYYPEAAGLNNGDFAVVWHKSGPDGSDAGVFGQIYDYQGALKGQNFQVNTYTDNSQAYADVAALQNGKFVVCWQSYGQDGSRYGIIAQIFNADGSKYNTEFIVNSTTQFEQSRPVIATLGNGDFVISWQHFNESRDDVDVMVQMFKEDGIKRAGEFPVNTYTNHLQYFPRISALSNGGFVICWISVTQRQWQNPNDQDGSGRGVFAQQFDSDGSKWGLEFQVNDYTSLDQSSPAVSNISEDRFVVCWQSDEQSDDIYGKYYYNRFSQPLHPFYLKDPPFDVSISHTSVTLTWTEAIKLRKNFPWDIDYTLHLDTDDNFSEPRVFSDIYDTTYTLNGLSPGSTYFWKILVSNGLESLWCTETFGFFVDWDAVTSADRSSNQLQEFKLHQNYPNPFNPQTIINYELVVMGYVKLTVLDITGREVATLVNEEQSAGEHNVIFNANNLASGVYFYHIRAGSYSATRKMLLVR